MKTYKKNLHIATNFDQQGNVLSSPESNNEEFEFKLRAVELLERLFCLHFSKNITSCWKALKAVPEGFHKQIKQTKSRRHKTLREQQIQERRRYSHAQSKSGGKTQRSVEAVPQFIRNRNKSLRVINQQNEETRAGILKQIVQKLRSKHRYTDSYESNNETNEHVDKQIIRRITKLEKMVHGIRGEIRGDLKISKSYISHDIIKSNNKNKQDEGDYIDIFMQEVQKIRKQVKQIKNSNSMILKRQVERERSRASSRQSRNQQEFKAPVNTIHTVPALKIPVPHCQPSPIVGIDSNFELNRSQNSRNGFKPLTTSLSTQSHFPTIYSHSNAPISFGPFPQNNRPTQIFPQPQKVSIQTQVKPSQSITKIAPHYQMPAPFVPVPVNVPAYGVHNRAQTVQILRPISVSVPIFCTACRRNCKCAPVQRR